MTTSSAGIGRGSWARELPALLDADDVAKAAELAQAFEEAGR